MEWPIVTVAVTQHGSHASAELAVMGECNPRIVLKTLLLAAAQIADQEGLRDEALGQLKKWIDEMLKARKGRKVH